MVNELLRKLEDYAQEYDVPILRPDSVEVLQNAARQKRPSRVLEIGTAIGYSAILLAQEMKEQGELISLDIDAARQETARQFIEQAALSVTVRLITGDAGAVISTLPGTFDFVFIDAAKGQYLNYLQAVLPKLAPGAVIVADNVLFRGWIRGDEAAPRRFRTIVKRLREYLAFVETSDLFQTRLFSVGDGVAVSIYQGNDEQFKQEGESYE